MRATPALAAALAAVAATILGACSSDPAPHDAAPTPTSVVSGQAATTTSGLSGRSSSSASSPTTTLPVSPADVVVPRDQAEVAATLTRVERAIRSNAYDDARSPAWAWEQQVAYGVLGAHPEWLEAVVAAVPPDLRDPLRATYTAGAALSAPDLGDTPAELPDGPADLPDWTIRVPRPPDELLRDYHEAETASGIPWQYLAAIHFVETKMGRIHGDSAAGARGPMQFLPGTWAEYGAGGDIDDDHAAILAAGRYLSAAGGPADMRRALFAYDPSDAYVAAVTGYADVMAAEPRAFHGFYGWQVFVATTHGDQLLPEGWSKPA